jgi:tripartite-type tricarboxylate transporter receptor subunit TctC
VATSIEHIKAGRLRALAVTSAMRVSVFPDLPTVGEFVPGYEGSGWQGISAPKQTPPDVVERLNREVNAALVDPDFRQLLTDLGVEPFASSPAQFGKYVADYTEKWSKVIRTAGIKAE